MHLWKNIIHDNSLFRDSKIVAAYSRNKNLKNYLVRSKITNEPKESSKNPKNAICCELNSGFYTCNSARCLTCKLHATEQKVFKSTTYERTFTIRQNLNCKRKNIIYLITCQKCNVQYVGETSRELRERATDHRSNISVQKRTPIGLHFNADSHSFRDIKITAIEQIVDNGKQNMVTILRQREAFWQFKLGTKYPAGLNCMPTD